MTCKAGNPSMSHWRLVFSTAKLVFFLFLSYISTVFLYFFPYSLPFLLFSCFAADEEKEARRRLLMSNHSEQTAQTRNITAVETIILPMPTRGETMPPEPPTPCNRRNATKVSIVGAYRQANVERMKRKSGLFSNGKFTILSSTAYKDKRKNRMLPPFRHEFCTERNRPCNQTAGLGISNNFRARNIIYMCTQGIRVACIRAVRAITTRTAGQSLMFYEKEQRGYYCAKAFASLTSQQRKSGSSSSCNGDCGESTGALFTNAFSKAIWSKAVPLMRRFQVPIRRGR